MENSEENLCFSHTMLGSVKRETVHSLGEKRFKGKSEKGEDTEPPEMIAVYLICTAGSTQQTHLL